MAEQLDLATFTGAHPTTAQLVEQLRAWGFRQRSVEGVHLVFRGPHGGSLRVLRSLMGRADAGVVAKAARLLDVDPRTFWDGPAAHAERLASAPDAAVTRRAGGQAVHDGEATHDEARGGSRVEARDQIIAQVLAVHVAMDQPLSLGQVVALCDEPLTRAQVSGASSQLCRDGQLVRIRTGVYQWAAGTFGQLGQHLAPPPAQARPFSRVQPRCPARPMTPAAALVAAPPRMPAPPASSVLFAQLFPDGVRMTADMLADLERWAQLTERLAAHTSAS